MKQTLNDKPDCSNSPSTGGLGELEPEEFWSVFEKGVACEKKKKSRREQFLCLFLQRYVCVWLHHTTCLPVVDIETETDCSPGRQL